MRRARSRARRLYRSTDVLLQRLWNWSRFARRNPDIPRVRLSAIYEMWTPYGSSRDEGWGEPEAAPVTEDCDDDDAEVMNVWIMQLADGHKVNLCRRFVLDQHVHHLDIDAALRALEDLMYHHDLVIDRMER